MDDDDRTPDRILAIAESLVSEGGVGALTFDAIAARLGRSKQAVLYWYPTKQALMAALYLPWLEAEADIAERALDGARTRRAAIAAFVTALADHHLAGLDRFRMTYLAPQVPSGPAPGRMRVRPDARIYPVTGRLYAALARHLGPDPEAARREAVAIHSAVLGLVLMVSLTEALEDPMKHGHDDLVDALVRALTG